jgi:hypothetical protein
MLPTPQLRTELRELVEEVIAPGQADTDTRFTDAVIDAILTASDHINQAAATAWQRKAAKALDERGGLQEARSGDEALKFVTQKDFREHCMAMAEIYARKAPGKGSRLLAIDYPYQLGVE